MRLSVFLVGITLSTTLLTNIQAANRGDILRSLPSILEENGGKDMKADLYDQKAIFYSEDNCPKAYQHDGGVHWAYYNISGGADRVGKGNANVEFPWSVGGGLHNSKSFTTAKVITLPDNAETGRKWPIVYTHVGGSRPILWYYPIGTRVSEIIGVTHGGYDYPFEVRSLIRHKEHWSQETARQTWTVDELIEDSKKWGYENYANKLSEVEVKQIRMYDNIHPRKTIDVVGPHFVLPEGMPQKLVLQLLSKPLRIDYNEEYGFTASKPTFIPAVYRGSHVGNDGSTENCMKCHKHVGRHVNEFGPVGRDWYGFVRGSDGIFSWHPFVRTVANSSRNPRAISNNGFGGIPTIAPELLTNGTVERYNRNKHPIERYTRIKELR